MFFCKWRSPVMAMAAILIFSFPAYAGGLSIKPGLWEVRTYTKTQGMPSNLPPVPARSEQCITADMLKGESDLQLLVGRQDECQLSNRRQEESGGNAPTVWYMECENHRNFRIRGDAELLPIAPGRYMGTVAFESDSGSSKVQGEIRFVGTRKGNCPKKG